MLPNMKKLSYTFYVLCMLMPILWNFVWQMKYIQKSVFWSVKRQLLLTPCKSCIVTIGGNMVGWNGWLWFAKCLHCINMDISINTVIELMWQCNDCILHDVHTIDIVNMIKIENHLTSKSYKTSWKEICQFLFLPHAHLNCHHISNTRCTKYSSLNVSRPVLQLSLLNSLHSGVKSRMEM